MKIFINQQVYELEGSACVADALTQFAPRAPFAVAVNGEFVARAGYRERTLTDGDRLDVVQPVAGG